MKSQKIFSILLFAFLSQSGTTWAVSGVGQVFMTVLRSLSVIETQAMAFPSSSPGDAEATIEPGDNNSSSFKILGEPNMSFLIQLPTQITLKTGSGATPEEMIQINSFKSFPEGGSTLNSQGEQEIFVGATRAALLPNQAYGSYSGSYSLTLVY